jgi:SAM-dependent methyltransferase
MAQVWVAAEAYEPYVGRWSRVVGREFLAWLNVPKQGRWLDVGSGTGALTGLILELAEPVEVVGVDRTEVFVDYARAHVTDPRARFLVGDAQELPVDSGHFDATVSGLVLNFVPEPQRAIRELARAVRAGGPAAAYVWDYSEGMQMQRYFWDAAVELDPAVAGIDEGKRFDSVCSPDRLSSLFLEAGFQGVETRAIQVPTVFRDFDDYWKPFLGGTGPAPNYAVGLDEERRDALRDRIRSRLPVAPDGSIPLTTRAWAVKGRRPETA